MNDDCKARYLQDFAARARYEVGQNFRPQPASRKWFQGEYGQNKIFVNQYKPQRD